MRTLKQSRSKLNLAALIIVIGLLLLDGSVITLADTSDTTIDLEVIWKADTLAHPIEGGGGIAVDGSGNLYVLDYVHDGHTYQIHKFDQDGQFVMSWGKTGNGPGEFNWRPANPEDGPDAGFIAADQEGNVYVSDSYNFRVQKFNSDGEFLLEWGSQGEGEGQFVPPAGGPISVSPEGDIYVSDFAHVQSFDHEGKFLSQFGSFGSDEGQFQGAAQVDWDSQGNIYVADLLNARFEKFDPDGNFLSQVGIAGEGDSEFYWPLYVAVDSHDHVFVADNTNRLQAFDTDGSFLIKWTEPGNGDGPFDIVGAVVVDHDDNVYVAFYREQDGISIYKFRQQ